MQVGLRHVKPHSPLRSAAFISKAEVHDIHGTAIAQLALVPPAYASHTVRALRRAPNMAPGGIAAALEKAGALFKTGVLCGLSPEAYVEHVHAVSGLPASVIAAALVNIGDATARAGEIAALGLPRAASWFIEGHRCSVGGAQIERRGEVLAVIAPGNGPGPHAIWPQAVALGLKIALRPSSREPFTAERLVAAMSVAGLGERVAYLPGDHDIVDALIGAVDLSLIYGGDAAEARYGDSSRVLVQGPGRSKLVIGRDAPRALALRIAFESIAGLGGAACVCASAVFVEDDAESFAHELNAYALERFRRPDERARWSPRFGAARLQLAHHVRATIDAQASPGGAFPLVSWRTEGGGHSVLPLLGYSASPPARPISEWPLAAALVVPFRRGGNAERDRYGHDVSAVLTPALSLTLLSEDEALISAMERLPGIRNFYVGPLPTTWMGAHLPHDGFLSEFLVTTRSYRRVSFTAG